MFSTLCCSRNIDFLEFLSGVGQTQIVTIMFKTMIVIFAILAASVTAASQRIDRHMPAIQGREDCFEFEDSKQIEIVWTAKCRLTQKGLETLEKMQGLESVVIYYDRAQVLTVDLSSSKNLKLIIIQSTRYSAPIKVILPSLCQQLEKLTLANLVVQNALPVDSHHLKHM